jgi:hypothetical protein
MIGEAYLSYAPVIELATLALRHIDAKCIIVRMARCAFVEISPRQRVQIRECN